MLIGDDQCMTLALRKRCHNHIMQGKWKLRYNHMKLHRNKHCEINFLPLVLIADDVERRMGQRLTCQDLPGFAVCPALRPQNETNILICDPLKSNTGSCSTTRETVKARCKRFERRDRAVLISGGWDQLTSRPQYKDNLLAMRQMLKENGFSPKNINIFYANGVNGKHQESQMYPAAFKSMFRYHLQKICHSPNCTDSLVLYLHSPTRNDGASILWDINGNGRLDENEVYTIRELLYDVQDCSVKQIYIIADQGYSGQLIHSLQNSSHHQNVLAFASGHVLEYSWQGEYTKIWRNFTDHYACVEEIHKAALTYTSSEPSFYDGSKGTIRTTLCGASCQMRRPFTI